MSMELRHLRYFVAIAEAGSFTQAAAKRLHTAQPSLSRQIRALEAMLKVPLIVRGPRGLSLTAAGQVFLEHARVILAQADAAIEAARRAHKPAKTRFTVGFLTGHEIGWLPRVLRVLANLIETTELIIHSASSPELLQALMQDQMDIAFVQPDDTIQELRFRPLIEEELFVLLPADHRLAQRQTIRVADIGKEPFISFSASYSPALRQVIDDYNISGIAALT
jgi:LysR family transcriptional regulator, hca operon transcriptional activator